MKKVLFVCVENSCRSQIAEGFSRAFGKGIMEAYSAGSKSSGKVNSLAIEVMREVGIDISNNISKSFSELAVSNFDYVITMGCQDVCPIIPARKHIEWQIDDPKGKDMDFFRKVRDDISYKVGELIKNVPLDN